MINKNKNKKSTYLLKADLFADSDILSQSVITFIDKISSNWNKATKAEKDIINQSIKEAATRYLENYKYKNKKLNPIKTKKLLEKDFEYVIGSIQSSGFIGKKYSADVMKEKIKTLINEMNSATFASKKGGKK